MRQICVYEHVFPWITHMYNPSLTEENRNQVSPVIAPRKNTSLYDWLEENGRFRKNDNSDFDWSTDDEELLSEYSSSNEEASYVPKAA
ncbi:hypothetical protein AM10699_35510 [Acaryochloris marina MBIC10699]|nr:hypothetical protein AM10699_35510 [Acaryochloris marina MBIC10699]